MSRFLDPEKVNIDGFGFDEKHINVERQHQITRETAQCYINEAEIALKRWNGQFMNYYSRSGAAYVDMKNKNVRTAFSNEEFDENVKKILEVIEKYGK